MKHSIQNIFNELSDYQLLRFFHEFSRKLINGVDADFEKIYSNIPSDIKSDALVDILSKMTDAELAAELTPGESIAFVRQMLSFWADDPDFSPLIEEEISHFDDQQMASVEGVDIDLAFSVLFITLSTTIHIKCGNSSSTTLQPNKAKGTGLLSKLKGILPITAVRHAQPVQNAIFISYRRDDAASVAGRIDDHIRIRFGEHASYIDVRDNQLGKDFRQQIRENLQQCKVQLVIIGKNWLNAVDENGKRRIDNPEDWVRIEVGIALKMGIPVIPVCIEQTELPTEKMLPEDLKELTFKQAARIRSGYEFDADIERLMNGINKSIQYDETG